MQSDGGSGFSRGYCEAGVGWRRGGRPRGRAVALVLGGARVAGGAVVVEARGTARAARCPACGAWSARVHGRYRRRPLDLPWRGRVVRLAVAVRRFRCGAPGCGRTFAEAFGRALPRRARRTAGADGLLAVAR